MVLKVAFCVFIVDGNTEIGIFSSSFNYDTRTQETKGVDRNIYFLYGCIRAIIACLNQLDTKTKQGNERVVGGEKPQESYIPEVSPNTLMNEIYKYIRGN